MVCHQIRLAKCSGRAAGARTNDATVHAIDIAVRERPYVI